MQDVIIKQGILSLRIAFKSSFDIALSGFFMEGSAFIVIVFAARQCHFQFRSPAFEVNFQRDKRKTFFAGLAEEL